MVLYFQLLRTYLQRYLITIPQHETGNTIITAGQCFHSGSITIARFGDCSVHGFAVRCIPRSPFHQQYNKTHIKLDTFARL